MAREQIKKFDVRDVKIGDIIKKGDLGKESFDVGIIGLPFDGSTRGRPGARFAPKVVREKIFSYSAYCFECDADLSKLEIGDYGDINLGYGSVELAKKAIKESLGTFYSNIDLGIVLGGDHSITEPSFGALAEEKGGSFGLVIIDAHHDLRKLEGGFVSSGTVINDIIEKYGKYIDPQNIVQIGIRGFVNSKYYVSRAKELGIKVFTSSDVYRFGAEKVIKDVILNILSEVDHVYFSFDVDGVDSIYAPGVNAPSIGGLSALDVFTIAYNLGKFEKTVAMDVTEFAPAYDIAGITSDLVANAILYFIAGYASR